MNIKEELLNKIENKTAVVAVIGLGYVGLPLAVEKAKAGYKTIGFDIQSDKVNLVNEGKNYIGDVVDDDLELLVRDGGLSATTDFSIVKEADFIAICVPTPLDLYKQPDISYVKNSAKNISKYMKKGTIVVLESTTYPGTTEELLLPILEMSGLKCGEDFFLAFSPERVDPGNLIYKTKNTPKVVGGVNQDSTDIAASMYENVLEGKIFKVSSPKVAEMEKILENMYRNVNIGLANEMAIICDKMGIDVWEVIDAAKTKPYGFQAFYPGSGVGGHCIPLDPYYLSWKAKEYDYHMKLIEASTSINDDMPDYVVMRVSLILNRFKKALNGSKILLMGVAYKQDISDYRESPAIKVIEKLENNGVSVEYYDPYIKEFNYKGMEKVGLSEINPKLISEFDAIIITTNHSDVDYKMLVDNAKVIFDTKNTLKEYKIRDNIEVL